MARVRLDRLAMDQQAQAQGQSALYEARNLDPDEVQGFKRRHGSEVPSDGGTVNAPGITGRGDNSYLRLDADFRDDAFTIGMAVKLGSIGRQSSLSESGYHILACVRGNTAYTVPANDIGLPHSGYIVYAVKTGATYKIGFGLVTETDDVASLSAKKVELDNGGANFAVGDSVRVVAIKTTGGTPSLKLRVQKVGGSEQTGTYTTAVASGSTTGKTLEILGAANMRRKDAGDEPVIQQLVIYESAQDQAVTTILPDARSNYGTPDYKFRLNLSDTMSDSAIASEIGSVKRLLHKHPAPPAILNNGTPNKDALHFGGDAGAFEVRFSSEFLSLFETKVRNVINGDWSVYIQTTPGENFKEGGDRTLMEFGKLAHLSFSGSGGDKGKLNAKVNGSGSTDGVTITTASALSADAEVDVVLQHLATPDSSDKNIYLYVTTTSNDTSTKVTGRTIQDTEMDLRRLYSVLLGANEAQTAGTYYSGAITKFALYPFHTTRGAGKDGAIFYFDFSDGNYEDQANSLPAKRSYHSNSTQTPAYTQGSSVYTDGKFIGVGGGLAFTDSGPLSYASYLTKPLTTDLHTQQSGRNVFFVSGNYAHVADTKQLTARPLGIPDPGTKVQAVATGGGVLDGIYTYGYRFVSKNGTPGSLRRLDPVQAFDSSSVQVGIPGVESGGGVGTGERELGASQGITESPNTIFAGETYSSGASFYSVKDPGASTSDLQLFEKASDGSAINGDNALMGVDVRLSVDADNNLFESIFNRGVTMTGKGAATDRWMVHRRTQPPSFDDDWSTQVSFRFADPIRSSPSGNYCNVPLICFNSEDTYSGDAQNGQNAVGMLVGLVKGDDDHEGGANGSDTWGYDSGTTTNYWRLVVAARKNNYGSGRRTEVKMSSGYNWTAADPNGLMRKDDQVHPASSAGGGSGDNPFGTGVSAHKQFFIDNHDYSVFVTKQGTDLLVAAIDVTGLDLTGQDPLGDRLQERAFYGKHEDFFSDTADQQTTRGAGDFVYFGGCGSREPGNTGGGARYYGTAIQETPYINAAGATVTDTSENEPDDGGKWWNWHGWFRDQVFYHGRVWSTSIDTHELLQNAWKRNAALAQIGVANSPGPLNDRILNDVAGVGADVEDSVGELFDPAGSAAAGTNWNFYRTAYATDYTGIHPGGKKNALQYRGSELPIGTHDPASNPSGISETFFPLVFVGVDDHEVGAQPFRFYASNLFDGSLILDNGGADSFILARQLWREDISRSNVRNIDTEAAIYQSLGSTRYNFGANTWYSFILRPFKDASGDITFSAYNFRINGQGDTPDGMGSSSQSYFAASSISQNPANKLAAADLIDSNGFVFLGGHPKVTTSTGSTRFDELRIWDGDRWDVSNNNWKDNGYYQEQNLAGRLETRWAPDADPDQNTNYLLVYAKFQPYDTSEYDSANLSLTSTQLAHYGQWAYYDDGNTRYDSSRAHNVILATAPDSEYTDAEPGMVNDHTGGSGDDPPVADEAPSLPFPKGPKHSVAAIELFRSRGLELGDRQQDDNTLARMTEAARGAPLQLLARLPLHDRSFVDSVYDDDLGFEVDDSHGTVPPEVVKGIFTWQDQTALISDQRNLYFAEPGPYGWESFPDWLVYQVPVDIAGGEITAGAELGQGAIVAGKSWAAVLTGTPSSPDAFSLGGGVGAYDAHNLIAHAGAAYAFNGRLWRIDTQGQVTEISKPVENYLPGASQGKLSISAKLSSLFLLNTSTGLALRFHFPSGRWFVEDRGAIDMGDLSDGEDAWISAQGVYAKGATGQVGDFLPNGATSIAASYNANISATGGSAAAN